MRFSSSANCLSNCLRFCSCCSRACCWAASRGSNSGRAARRWRNCVSKVVCRSCRASIWRWRSSKSSPMRVRAEYGMGLVARPWATSPPPAKLAWAMAWAFSGRSWLWALTKMTSSAVSLNTRLNCSGATKRTVSSTACTAKERSSASASGELSFFTAWDYRGCRPHSHQRQWRWGRQ